MFMKTRLHVSLATAAAVFILLSGCVSSKKYKGSQAELARVRNDSSRLAQQVSSLNGNVQDLQNKNTTLQRSLDSSSSSYANQQKSLDYYQNYFKDQQNTLSQVGDDVKGALTQAGISNGDVQMMDNAVYVRLDEDELFKANSTAVKPGGKKVLDNLANVIRSRQNVNVFVARGDSAGGAMAGGSDNMSSGNMSGNESGNMTEEAPAHHRTVHHRSHAMASRSSSGTATGGSQSGSSASGTNPGGSNATAQNGGSKTPVHHKVHHHYSSEGSMAIYNGPGHMHNRAWALKQARMVTVANHFLQNGVAKINVSLQQPGMAGNPQDKNIRVIITPKMNDFTPPANRSSSMR
jgi:outer membrane protein OmpA-like peptidoglycan-associated protein